MKEPPAETATGPMMEPQIDQQRCIVYIHGEPVKYLRSRRSMPEAQACV